MADLAQFVATVVASAAGSLGAAALGYRYALARFRRERRFDRQLEWYERATKAFIEAANRINWAIASEEIGLPEDEQRKCWIAAHESLLALQGLEPEAALYGLPSGYEAVAEAVSDVAAISRLFLVANLISRQELRRVQVLCGKVLRHAAARLADDMREHLELAPLDRPVGLYDRDFRELQSELSRIRGSRGDLGAEPREASPPHPQAARVPPNER
jgi:hypothetical protein